MRINKSLITNQITGAGTGSVTSVAMTVPTGFVVSGSPITSSGTLSITFASGYSLPQFPSQTGNNGKYLTTDGTNLSWATVTGGGVSGTVNYLAKFDTTASVADSIIYENGFVGIGTTTAGTGSLIVSSTTADNHLQLNGTAPSIRFTDTPTSATYNQVIAQALNSNDYITNTVVGDMAIANASGQSIIFGIGTSEAMRIFTTTRNVSIGGNSTDSGFKFDVANADARINGVRVGKGNGSFSSNTAVGVDALNAFTGTIFGSNTAIGFSALKVNTTGSENTAIGTSAMFSTTTATSNVAIGTFALYTNTTGGACVAVGLRSLFTSNANHNVAIGNESSRFTTSGANNTSVGSLSSREITTGQGNTTLGYQAGRGITTGSYNTIIGANVTGLSSTLSNNIIIADGQGNQRINGNSSGSVGFGTGTNINASAKVQIDSTTQGFLPPRMTGAQAEAISSPAAGLMVYANNGNGTTITSIGWWGYDGTNWVKIG